MSQKVAIQGIPGSFHHQVALLELGKNCEIIPFSTFEPVAKAIADQKADVAVMAIENSIAGAILPNYELIDRYDLHIWDEYYLPISHQLMALPGQKIQDLTEVRSHPMALLQCKQFLGQFPHLSQKDDIDTATVAKRIQDEQLRGTAAIASKIAAEIYGLEIFAKDIQSVKNNFTRFILLGKNPKNTPDANKASLKITIKNESGGLASLLTMLAGYGLNLSKIQSIPVMEKPWEYAFFIDAVYENKERYLSAMSEVKSSFGELKIFGEYKSRKP